MQARYPGQQLDSSSETTIRKNPDKCSGPSQNVTPALSRCSETAVAPGGRGDVPIWLKILLSFPRLGPRLAWSKAWAAASSPGRWVDHVTSNAPPSISPSVGWRRRIFWAALGRESCGRWCRFLPARPRTLRRSTGQAVSHCDSSGALPGCLCPRFDLFWTCKLRLRLAPKLASRFQPRLSSKSSR